MEKKCERCGTPFETNKSIQRFCSPYCRHLAQNASARARKRLQPKEVEQCNITDCAFYSENEKNCCGTLSKVVLPCCFYKPGTPTGEYGGPLRK